jgi:hypothetical protein
MITTVSCVPRKKTPTPSSAGDVDSGKEESKPTPASPFSYMDCGCKDVDLPLGSLRASSSPIVYTTASGSEFLDVEYLYCRWEESHTSPEKKGTIYLGLDIYQLDNQEDADHMFHDFRAEIPFGEEDCSDGDCIVEISEFNHEAAYLVLKTKFIRGDGVTFPSSHYATKTRLINAGNKGGFVMYLYLEHPELGMEDTWITDMVQVLESCAMDLIEKY